MNNPASNLNQPLDVLIVGGGSAGATLAARLSEDPSRRVLLVEAGPAFAPDKLPDELSNPERVPAPELRLGLHRTRWDVDYRDGCASRPRPGRQFRSERGRRDTCPTSRRGIMASSRRRRVGVGQGPRIV